MNQEYELGKNVTDSAEGENRRGTVVLSLRMSGTEFDAISDSAERQGKTVSQVAREAIRSGLSIAGRDPYQASISFTNGAAIHYGDITMTTHPWSGNPRQDYREELVTVDAS